LFAVSPSPTSSSSFVVVVVPVVVVIVVVGGLAHAQLMLFASPRFRPLDVQQATT
jgi:hypothetical protein